jgi:hypothetical protein
VLEKIFLSLIFQKRYSFVFHLPLNHSHVFGLENLFLLMHKRYSSPGKGQACCGSNPLCPFQNPPKYRVPN